MALRTIPRHDPPARSAERQALAVAIEAAAEAERSLDAARRAAARAEDFVEKAGIRLAATREASAEQRRLHVQGLAEAARTGAPAASSDPVREASRAVAEAEAEFEMAESAAVELRSQRAPREAALLQAKNRLVNAVDNVIRAEAERLIAECKAAEAELLRRRAMLYFLRRPHVQAGEALHGAVPSPFVGEHDFQLLGERDRAFEAMKDAIDDVLHRPIFAGEANWNRHEAVRPWIQARQALFSDADAPLPTE
jgi:hypothetical protein